MTEPDSNLLLDPRLRDALRGFSAAILYEAAGEQGALPSAIKPVAAGMRLCGPAFPLETAPGDNLPLHRALSKAAPGAVLVVSTGGFYEAGYWGEIMSTAARQRRLGGLVIDACVRDGSKLAEIAFPVFARGLCLRATTKNEKGHSALNTPVQIGDVRIHPGDVVTGDEDGVVVIPAAHAERALARAREQRTQENNWLRRIREGAQTLDLLGFPSSSARKEESCRR